MRPVSPLPILLAPRSWLLLPSLLGLALSSGCTSTKVFECTADTDCEGIGEMPKCESNSYCTYTDAECTSGRRWHDEAGDDLGGACFDPADLDPTGGSGTATGTGTAGTSSTTGNATGTGTTTAETTSTTSEASTTDSGESSAATAGETAEASGTPSESSAGDGSGSGDASGSEAGSSAGGESTTGSDEGLEECMAAYGDLPGYTHCSSTPTRCRISVMLGASDFRNCNGACGSAGDGWSCVDAFHNPEGGGCEPSQDEPQGACDEEANDQICVCEFAGA